MPTLPWTRIAQPAADAEVVVMASHFKLTSLLRVPRFLYDAMRIRAQATGADGAFGVSLVARPLAREFYTLSAWRDRDAITSFVRAEPHRSTMTRHRAGMADSKFVFYDVAGDALPPSWDEARTRLRS